MRYLLPFALILAAVSAAAHLPNSPVTVDVVDLHGRALPLFEQQADSRPDRRRAYLQAEAGQRYALRVTNRSGGRVGVVLAVDGRNVISGRRSELARTERMYVLDPWESATYRGWRTGRDTVNEFYFTREADSYAAAFGDKSALGVIAMAAFAEKSVVRRYDHAHPGHGRAPAKTDAPSSGQRSTGDAAAMQDEAATGFGESRHSPSRAVTFRPARRALTRSYIRYAWASTLCEWGVTSCRHEENRLWPATRARRDDGFAPPPGYRTD